ncbi:MAG: thrombospondin type 3 repeat-containing protein, partial [Pontiella sp.]|nr:thrombospondin type 3 repeat-containing protein [Pontiella sp.]
ADTDGDGFSDLAEMQGGSNPLDDTSIPDGDMVILNAAEIGYLPKGTNTMVTFQAVDSLSEGSWFDVGSAHTNAGDWVYQFDSMRTNGNSRFYRAIEE